jgi:hypothetical protein
VPRITPADLEKPGLTDAARSGCPGAGPGGGATRGGAALDQLAPLGEYTITLTVAGKTLTTKARIAKTQGWSIGMTPETIR